MIKADPHGYFLDDSEEGHHFDTALCDEFCRMFKRKMVIDLGCGKGKYVENMLSSGRYAIGVDGSSWNGALRCFGNIDLSRPMFSPTASEVAISLEVGKHIPAEFEDVFLDNVANNASELIVLSWAIPGQGGRGHVNESPNSWVISKMADRGWFPKTDETIRLRSIATLPWFKKSLMVFVK